MTALRAAGTVRDEPVIHRPADPVEQHMTHPDVVGVYGLTAIVCPVEHGQRRQGLEAGSQWRLEDACAGLGHMRGIYVPV